MAIIEASTLSISRYSTGFMYLANSGKFFVATAPDVGARFVDTATLSDISSIFRCWPLGISPDDTILASCPLDASDSISIWDVRSILPRHYTISSPLINIGNVALVAWYEGRLADAEEALSSEIAHQSDTRHDAYASRALVRARLGHWNASIEDARMSLHIRPTTIGRIAEGVASTLSGQGDLIAGMLTFDSALHNDFWYERELILLIKAIIVFKLGHHEAGLRHLSEITRITFDKPMSRFVEAYMHLLCGQDSMKHKNYETAIESFANARDLGEFGKVPRLDTIFLLFGWDFGSFWFTLHQMKYVALVAAERRKDAADLLDVMTAEFGDDMTTAEKRATWVVEILGDTIMQEDS